MTVFFLMIPIPITLLGLVFYNHSKEVILQNVEKSYYSVVSKNTELIDVKLEKIEDKTLLFSTDKGVYDIFSQPLPQTPYELMQVDKVVSGILYQHFQEYSDIYATYVVSDKMTFGNRTHMYIPHTQFKETTLYESARKAEGSMKWVPTFDFTKTFHLEIGNVDNIDYRYLFAAIKTMNPSYISTNYTSSYNQGGGAVVKKVPKGVERPVHIVVFQEEFFRRIYEGSIAIEDHEYFVLNEAGLVISDKKTEGIGAPHIYLDKLQSVIGQNGYQPMVIEGEDYLVCYATSQVTNWTSIALIPYKTMVGQLKELRGISLLIGIVLTVLSAVCAIVLSGVLVNPIKKLIAAMEKVGKGDFDTRIANQNKDEIGILVEKFNNMNQKIGHLIDENYHVKLREKEAHIMALNLQLNPHFLTNTLNIINWMAIEEEQDEISEMIISLSQMMDYTIRQTKEVVTFEEDLLWLKGYLHIMMTRFDNAFNVHYDIEAKILKSQVPKLFLQPLVENAIIHGFSECEEGGVLTIKAYQVKKNGSAKSYFEVMDNGKGFSPDKLDEIIHSPWDGKSIGIKNVEDRIRLLFGTDSRLEIITSEEKTMIRIILPL